jgi:NADP-dependent 3-hydroxy acid dehydrogenase YdfG
MALAAHVKVEMSATNHKTALIIGGSGGIGRAVAAVLAASGMDLALVARDVEKLERTRLELGLSADRTRILACDVTERTQVAPMVEQALAGMGSIDIVVCASGLNVRQRSLRSLDPADWDRIIAANATGAFNVIHAVLPSMRTRGSGLIVQISSLSGLRSNTVSGAAYSAAKFAQSALGIAIGREERGRGIRSTVIFAGEVNTEFLDARAVRPGGAADDGRRQRILQPDDVAAAVRFVAELPPTAHVPELVIKPTIDDFS